MVKHVYFEIAFQRKIKVVVETFEASKTKLICLKNIF